MDNFTYDDYLKQWADRYAGESSGEFFWYHRGVEYTKIYRKMSRNEFMACKERFTKYFVEIQKMTEEERFDSEYDRLLDKSFFECELPLFF